jgi:organic radical activating enzyme
MQKPVLSFLETMIVYGCNLSCVGCTNYSDYDVKGMVSWAQGKQWLEQWLERIEIPDFGIMGGEPLMNPEVEQWVVGCRELLPDSQIRFTTNGVMLHKKQSVIDALMDIGNCVIKLSVHQPREFYTQTALQYLFSKAKWTPVVEHGIQRWQSSNGVRLQISMPTKFVKTYLNDYSSMLPHQSEPQSAFDICIQQTCPLLLEGRIYKCSSIALLNRVLDDWNVKNTAWDYYKSYQGLEAGCDSASLNNFISSFGKAESICSMCPTANDHKSIINHHDTTTTKIKWLKEKNAAATR